MKHLGRASHPASREETGTIGLTLAGRPGTGLAGQPGPAGPADRLARLAAMVPGMPRASITMAGESASRDRIWTDADVADHLPRHWSDSDLDVLAALAQVVADEAALEAAFEQQADDLAAAGHHPVARLPRIPGLQVAVRCVTGQSGTGRRGIFYDAFPAPARRWGLVIGEVRGEVRPAGMSTTFARYTLRAQARGAGRASSILASLNRAVLRWPAADRQQFAVICAIVRPVVGGAIVQVCLAGMAGALVRRASGEVQPIGPPAVVLGMNGDPGLRDSRRLLRAGDSLIMVSGGVTEARDRTGTRRFGDSQLSQVVADLGAVSAARATDAVLRAAAEHSGGKLDAYGAALVVKVPGNRSGTGSHAAAWPGTHPYPTLADQTRPRSHARR
jgi:hypothetical protein